VHTLARYLEHNASLQATARELTLHVNTVGYRLRRIQAITGLDFDRADDRLRAQVALRIRDGVAPAEVAGAP
jgi:purine catabolism regulator